MHRIAASAIVILTTVVLTACGGDDDGDETQPAGAATTTSETAATDAWATQVDAICAKANTKETALDPPPPGSRDPKQLDLAFIVPFQKIGRDALVQIKAVPLPEEDKQAATAFVESLEALFKTVDERIVEIRAKDESAAGSLIGDYQSAQVEMATAAGAAGLADCQSLGI